MLWSQLDVCIIYRIEIIAMIDIKQLLYQLRKNHQNAQIARVNIVEAEDGITILIYTARPGILIGRRGAKIKELKDTLEAMFGLLKIQIVEVKSELEPVLIADAVMRNVERGISIDKILDRQSQMPLRFGAAGCRIVLSGPLENKQFKISSGDFVGDQPIDTKQDGVRYGVVEGRVKEGVIRCEVWIFIS